MELLIEKLEQDEDERGLSQHDVARVVRRGPYGSLYGTRRSGRRSRRTPRYAFARRPDLRARLSTRLAAPRRNSKPVEPSVPRFVIARERSDRGNLRPFVPPESSPSPPVPNSISIELPCYEAYRHEDEAVLARNDLPCRRDGAGGLPLFPVVASDSADSFPSRGRIAPVDASDPVPVSSRPDVLRDDERQIVGFLLEKYGETDWSVPLAWVAANLAADANPNVMMIPLSLAQAGMLRWRTPAASPISRRPLPGRMGRRASRRLGHPVAFAACRLLSRLDDRATPDGNGGNGSRFARCVVVRAQALAIDAVEADARLLRRLPLPAARLVAGRRYEGGRGCLGLCPPGGGCQLLPSAEHAAAWDAKAPRDSPTTRSRWPRIRRTRSDRKRRP